MTLFDGQVSGNVVIELRYVVKQTWNQGYKLVEFWWILPPCWSLEIQQSSSDNNDDRTCYCHHSQSLAVCVIYDGRALLDSRHRNRLVSCVCRLGRSCAPSQKSFQLAAFIAEHSTDA